MELGKNDWERASSEDRFENRRDLIVRATRACFGRRGVRHTSIADIAREVGITRELFYYYFKSKGEAAEAVLAQYEREAYERLSQVVNDSRDVREGEALAEVLGALRTWVATDSDAHISMVDILVELAVWPQLTHAVAGNAADALGIARHDPRFVCLEETLVGAMTNMLLDEGHSDEELADALGPLFA